MGNSQVSALAPTKGRYAWLTVLAPQLAAAGLVVLVAHGLAGLTWRVLTPASDARVLIPSNPQIKASPQKKAPDYATRIAALHVFGQAPREAPAPVLDAPETNLNLTLRGVYATGDQQALAIIATGGRNEKFYHVGDVIGGGPILKDVYRDRVILENNRRIETLRLPRSKRSGITVAPASGAGGIVQMADQDRYSYDEAVSDATINTGPVRASGMNLGRLREQILQNPGRLGDMLQAVPARDESGQFQGYELIPQGNAQMFGQLGLQSGDVVTAVNGIAIDRPDKGLLALQDLVKADQVSVTVMRNGSEITIEHSLR